MISLESFSFLLIWETKNNQIFKDKLVIVMELLKKLYSCHFMKVKKKGQSEVKSLYYLLILLSLFLFNILYLYNLVGTLFLLLSCCRIHEV